MTHTKSNRWQQAPALIVSLVALFAALSGAAMALPGTETVNSGDIKNESIKSVDLKDDQAVASEDVIDQTLTGTDVQDASVTTDDVADQNLTGTDVAADTLAAQDLAPNSVGQSELQANSVRAEELGDGIKSRYANVTVPGGTGQNSNYNFAEATAECQAGEELISGAAQFTGEDPGDEVVVAEIIPNHNTEKVTVRGGNDSGDDAVLWAEANCL